MTGKRKTFMAHARARLAVSLRAAAQGFPRGGSEGEAVVHDARKELKRSAALARLFTPIIGAPAYGALDVVGAARRAIGRARDLDVLPGALANIKCAAETREALTRAIASEREKARDAHAGIDVKGLTADLTACAGDVDAWDLGGEAPELITASLRHTYRSAKRRGRIAWASGDADDLHDLRTKVVDLAYQIALFERAWPAMIAAEGAELHRLRTTLGNHNDLTMLGEFALSRRELTAEAAEALVALVLRRRKPLERRAFEQFSRIFAERPGAFERRFAGYLMHPQKKL
jgi:CHAD domain-containing protein